MQIHDPDTPTVYAFQKTVMNQLPPWRWPLWGPWPPGESHHPPPPTEDEIRERAYLLSQRRPWCTTEQNWSDARQELESPWFLRWRPSLLRWIGASEKKGWDWIVTLSIPTTIAFGGWLVSYWNSNALNGIAENRQKDEALREYFKEMKSILLDKEIPEQARNSRPEVKGIARALTLTTLAQLKGEDPERRSAVFLFLREVGLPVLGSSDETGVGANLLKYDLRGTNLSEQNLSKVQAVDADLRGISALKTNLTGATLWGADLREAILIETNLSGAKLPGANLMEAVLYGANLKDVKWSPSTKWPHKSAFYGAKNVPPNLKEELGLDKRYLID